jgi:hypothetical protein
MFNKKIMAIILPALFISSTANSATLYNNDGTIIISPRISWCGANMPTSKLKLTNGPISQRKLSMIMPV